MLIFYDNTFMEPVAVAAPVTEGITVSPNHEATPQTAPAPSPAKDDGAATRYQISRERELRVKAEKERAELEQQLKAPKPTFDDDSDPSGSKEIEYKIQQGIEEGLKKHVKELGLAETLEKIQYEREQEAFFAQVEDAFPKFKELGIEIPSRKDLQATLEALDTKGITREQLILLSKSDQVLGLLKPKGFAPGDGGKPTDIGRAQTQEERNAEIFKAHKVFGY